MGSEKWAFMDIPTIEQLKKDAHQLWDTLNLQGAYAAADEVSRFIARLDGYIADADHCYDGLCESFKPEKN